MSTPTRNLFIAGLPATANDAALEALFAEHGEVVSAKVMVDLHTGKSRGFGFVLFADVNAAIKAKAALNGLSVRADAVHPPLPHGYKLTVEFSNAHSADHVTAATDAIYVRNIPAGTPRDIVAKHFSTFGTVRKIELMPDTAPGACSKFIVARITFDTMEAAIAAEKGTQCAANVFSASTGGDGAPSSDAKPLPPLLAKLAERPSERAKRRHAVHETQKHLVETRAPHGNSNNQLPQTSHYFEAQTHHNQLQQQQPSAFTHGVTAPPCVRVGPAAAVTTAQPCVTVQQRVPSPPLTPSALPPPMMRMGMGTALMMGPASATTNASQAAPPAPWIATPPPPSTAPLAMHLLPMPATALSLEDGSLANPHHQVLHLTPVTYFRNTPDVDSPFARSRASSNASASLTPLSLGLMDSHPQNPFATPFSNGFATAQQPSAGPTPITLYLVPWSQSPAGFNALTA